MLKRVYLVNLWADAHIWYIWSILGQIRIFDTFGWWYKFEESIWLVMIKKNFHVTLLKSFVYLVNIWGWSFDTFGWWCKLKRVYLVDFVKDDKKGTLHYFLLWSMKHNSYFQENKIHSFLLWSTRHDAYFQENKIYPFSFYGKTIQFDR